HVVVASPIRIHKLNNHVPPDAVNKRIAPLLKRISPRLAAPLRRRPRILPPRRMRLNFIRRTVLNIDTPPIGLPSRHSRRVMRIRIIDPTVVLFLHLVLDRSRRRIPPLPELLHKLAPLLVYIEL